MVRKVCSPAMLICVAWASYMALQPHQALAMQASAHHTDPKAASLAAVKHCAINCGIVGLLVDPTHLPSAVFIWN
jgi:hypothetical protein